MRDKIQRVQKRGEGDEKADGGNGEGLEKTERHPLTPFFPPNASTLVLGSFPPPRSRWRMDFFYPNFQNDFWRIMGLLFFQDSQRFILLPSGSEKGRFNEAGIRAFLTEQGIAIFDAALEVVRLNGNASDRFLKVTRPFNLAEGLRRLPHCGRLVFTGEKAMETLWPQLTPENGGIPLLKPGEVIDAMIENRPVRIGRVCSSSRAYPLAIDRKVEIYRKVFLQ